MEPTKGPVDWKKIDTATRRDFLRWILEKQGERMRHGEEKYHGEQLGFQGDPLVHASEELFDGLFFVFYAMRERGDLRGKLGNANRLMSDIGTALDGLQELVSTAEATDTISKIKRSILNQQLIDDADRHG